MDKVFCELRVGDYIYTVSEDREGVLEFGKEQITYMFDHETWLEFNSKKGLIVITLQNLDVDNFVHNLDYSSTNYLFSNLNAVKKFCDDKITSLEMRIKHTKNNFKDNIAG